MQRDVGPFQVGDDQARKKGAADAKRREACSRAAARQIEVAAREGGGDIEGNPTLRRWSRRPRALDAQRQHRAGDQAGDRRARGRQTYEEMIYEGYAPGGVAVSSRR